MTLLLNQASKDTSIDRAYIVMAPNFHVQPVCTCSSYDKAVKAAQDFAQEWDTNTEVFEFHMDSEHGWFGTYRYLSPSEQAKLNQAKEILDKYFDEGDEDYQFLEFNICHSNSAILEKEAAKLEELGMEINHDAQGWCINYKFYKHNFNWDRRV